MLNNLIIPNCIFNGSKLKLFCNKMKTKKITLSKYFLNFRANLCPERTFWLGERCHLGSSRKISGITGSFLNSTYVKSLIFFNGISKMVLNDGNFCNYHDVKNKFLYVSYLHFFLYTDNVMGMMVRNTSILTEGKRLDCLLNFQVYFHPL